MLGSNIRTLKVKKPRRGDLELQSPNLLLECSKEMLLQSLKERIQRSRKAKRQHEASQCCKEAEENKLQNSLEREEPRKIFVNELNRKMECQKQECVDHELSKCEEKLSEDSVILEFNKKHYSPALGYIAVLQGSRKMLYPTPPFCRPAVSLFVNRSNPLLSLGLALGGNKWLEALDSPEPPPSSLQILSERDILLLNIQDADTFLTMCNEGCDWVHVKSQNFVGKLVAMCGYEEMIEKQQTSTANDLERLPATLQGDDEARLVNRYLVAKSFQRSDANKVFKEGDVRPLVWCRKTVHNLLILHLDADCQAKPWHIYRRDDVRKEELSLDTWRNLEQLIDPPSVSLGQNVDLSNGFKFLDIYNFLRDRFRSVWQDLTVQHCAKHRAFIESLEISFRFLLLSEELLCEEKSFNTVQNGDLMNTCLDKLLGGYADSRYSLPNLESKLPWDAPELYRNIFFVLVYRSPYEAEFWAYRIVMTLPHSLGNSNALLDVYRRIPPLLRGHPLTRLAIAAHRAFRERNPCRYFKILRQADYLLATLLHKFSGLIRVAYLEVLVLRFSRQRPRMPFRSFCEQFGRLKKGFTGEDLKNVESFCNSYRLRLAPERDPMCTSYSEWKIDYVYFGHVEFLSAADLHFKRLKCKHFRSTYLKKKWEELQLNRLAIVDPDVFKQEASLLEDTEMLMCLPMKSLPQTLLDYSTQQSSLADELSAPCVSSSLDAPKSSQPSLEHSLMHHPVSDSSNVITAKTSMTQESFHSAVDSPITNASNAFLEKTSSLCSENSLEPYSGSNKESKPLANVVVFDLTSPAKDFLGRHDGGLKNLGLFSQHFDSCQLFCSQESISGVETHSLGNKKAFIPPVSSREGIPGILSRQLLKRKHDDLSKPVTSSASHLPQCLPTTHRETCDEITLEHTSQRNLSGLNCPKNECFDKRCCCYNVSHMETQEALPTLHLNTTLSNLNQWIEQKVNVTQSLYYPLVDFFSKTDLLNRIIQEGIEYFSWNLLFTCSYVFESIPFHDSTRSLHHRTNIESYSSTLRGSFTSRAHRLSWCPQNEHYFDVVSQDLRLQKDVGSPLNSHCYNSIYENKITIQRYLSRILPQLFEMIYRQMTYGCSVNPSVIDHDAWITSLPFFVEHVDELLSSFIEQTFMDSGAELRYFEVPQSIASLWSSVNITVDHLSNHVCSPHPQRVTTTTPTKLYPCRVSCGFLMPYHLMPLTVTFPESEFPSSDICSHKKNKEMYSGIDLRFFSKYQNTMDSTFRMMSQSHLVWLIPFPFILTRRQGSQAIRIQLFASSLDKEFYHLVQCAAFMAMLKPNPLTLDSSISIFYALSVFSDKDSEGMLQVSEEDMSQVSCFMHTAWITFLTKMEKKHAKENSENESFLWSRIQSIQVYSFCVFHIQFDAPHHITGFDPTSCGIKHISLVPSGFIKAFERLSRTVIQSLEDYVEKKSRATVSQKKDSLYEAVYCNNHGNQKDPNIFLHTHKKKKLFTRGSCVFPIYFQFRWKELKIQSLPLLLIHNWKVHVERWLETNPFPTVNELLRLFVLSLKQMRRSFFFHKLFWNAKSTFQYTVGNVDKIPIVLSERHVVRSLVTHFGQRCYDLFATGSFCQDTSLKDFQTLGDFMICVRDNIRSLLDKCMLDIKPNLVYILPFPLHEELLGFCHAPWDGLPFPPQCYNGRWNISPRLKNKNSFYSNASAYLHQSLFSKAPCGIQENQSADSLNDTKHFLYWASPLSRSRGRLWAKCYHVNPPEKMTNHSRHEKSDSSEISTTQCATSSQTQLSLYYSINAKFQDTVSQQILHSPFTDSDSFEKALDNPIALLKKRLSASYYKLQNEIFENRISLASSTPCHEFTRF